MDREELLRSARNLYENPGTNEALKVVLEETYPELKESEDERIRKDLITFICQFAPEHLKVKYVAYLEKQKDERELGFIEGKIEGARQTCQEIKDVMSLFEPKDLTPFESTFRDYVDSAIRYCLAGEGYQQYIKEWAADLLNLEKQKEHKPAGWRPFDKEVLTKIKELIDSHFSEHEQREVYKDWLDEHISQPAEWSKGEEKMWVHDDDLFLDTAKMIVEDSPRKSYGGINKKSIVPWFYSLRERLKSLRPQPHWKPSDEQIQALTVAIDEAARCEEPYWRDSLQDVLLSLHTDLKKLF